MFVNWLQRKAEELLGKSVRAQWTRAERASKSPERKSRAQLISELLNHSLMGAALGLLCAMLLLASNAAGLRDFLAMEPSPGTAALRFVTEFAIVFAIGATLTGFMFGEFDKK